MTSTSNTSQPLTHPGTWLPGDRVVDKFGGECTRSAAALPYPWDDSDGDPAWSDNRVSEMVNAGRARITHLVPRDGDALDANASTRQSTTSTVSPVPSPASSADARRMLAARQEDAPVLPDTSGWVKREPGDLIEAGTRVAIYWPDRDAWAVETLTTRRVVSEDHAIHLTPPPSAPSPVDAIPVGRNNAVEAWLTFDYGNTGERVLGLWWRGEEDDMSVWRSRDEKPWSAKAVRKVEPLHVIPAELAEEIKAWAERVHPGRGSSSILLDVAEALR